MDLCQVLAGLRIRVDLGRVFGRVAEPCGVVPNPDPDQYKSIDLILEVI